MAKRVILITYKYLYSEQKSNFDFNKIILNE